jgi:hypothetical protein
MQDLARKTRKAEALARRDPASTESVLEAIYPLAMRRVSVTGLLAVVLVGCGSPAKPSGPSTGSVDKRQRLYFGTGQHAMQPRATLATFAGYWWGHTRGLRITRSGHADEGINAGCCSRYIDLAFQLLQARGTANNATATFRVTAVKLYNKKIYWKRNPGPRIDQLGELRLKNGVITEPLTGINYCGPHRHVCGA